MRSSARPHRPLPRPRGEVQPSPERRSGHPAGRASTRCLVRDDPPLASRTRSADAPRHLSEPPRPRRARPHPASDRSARRRWPSHPRSATDGTSTLAPTPTSSVRAASAGGSTASRSWRHWASSSAPHIRFIVQFDRRHHRLPAATARCRRTLAEVIDGPARALAADLVEALAQACRCQSPRDAVATLDSAWHRGLVDEADIAAVFARLPRRYPSPARRCWTLAASPVPRRSCASFCAVSASTSRCRSRSDGVGRVDLVVDGWLIVECDSRGAPLRLGGAEAGPRTRHGGRGAWATRPFARIAEDILYRSPDDRWRP